MREDGKIRTNKRDLVSDFSLSLVEHGLLLNSSPDPCVDRE